jgi:hypothetical protein
VREEGGEEDKRNGGGKQVKNMKRSGKEVEVAVILQQCPTKLT